MAFELQSAVHGIAPRSDELHLLGTAVEKGRAPFEDFEALRDQETAEWLAFQEASGVDIYENGKLHWQDRLRPIVESTTGFADGIDQAPVTRWFATNTFYRQPTIVGDLTFDPEAFLSAYGGVGETVSLLSPGDFADLCQVEHGRPDNVLNLYRQIVRGLGAVGVERVIFSRYSGEYGPLAFLDEALIVRDKDAPAIVQLPTKLTSYTSNRAGHRLASTQWLERWLPVIAGDTTAVDAAPTDQDLRELAATDLSGLVFTNTVDFEFLPLKHAKAKIEHLVEITNNANERIQQL